MADEPEISIPKGPMTSGELAYLAEGAMRDYVPSLAKYLTDSAAKGVVDAIVKARREGTGSPGVLREIEPLFSPERAARIAVTECLPPETLVDGAMVRAGFRRWYEGEMIDVLTESGRRFSATPNHPVLTGRGWLGAGEIEEGDNLICEVWLDSPRASSYPDVQAPPATIVQVLDALAAVGFVERVTGTEPDFHGDGRQSDVDVLNSDWLLCFGRFAPLYQPVVEKLFAKAYEARATFCRRCGRLQAVTQPSCFCNSSKRDVVGSQSSSHKLGADSEGLSDGEYRLSAGVAVQDRLAGYRATEVRGALAEEDAVQRVSTRWYAGHVYNLSTPTGYFTIGGGIVSGNTTKLFGAGAQAVYDAQGVQFWLWSTVKDPWVCSRCAEREGHRYSVALDDFEPLHVRCRCFPRPDHDKESLPGAELTDPYHRELATAEFQRMFPDAVRTGTGAPDLMLREWARSNGIDLFVAPDAVRNLSWPKAERVAQGIARSRQAIRSANAEMKPEGVHWEIHNYIGNPVADQRRETTRIGGPKSATVRIYVGHPAANSITSGEDFMRQQVEAGWWPKGTHYVDLIIHEAGHASQRELEYVRVTSWTDVYQLGSGQLKILEGASEDAAVGRVRALINREIGTYASQNPHEFVAEMFALLTRTSPAQINLEVMRLYRFLGGVIPEVLPP